MLAFARKNLDRCHSLALAASAPGGARRVPLLRFPKISSGAFALILVLFDRCHSPLLASPATGGARMAPRFDTLPFLGALNYYITIFLQGQDLLFKYFSVIFPLFGGMGGVQSSFFLFFLDKSPFYQYNVINIRFYAFFERRFFLCQRTFPNCSARWFLTTT